MPALQISEEEYFALELASDVKHEYYRGEVFAMTGASLRHNMVGGNVYASLHFQLRERTCSVLQNDMRVSVSATGLYTYPDIVVFCGEPELIPNRPDTLLNPILIVEVLSPTTESYDRGKKFEHYRMLESLQEYVLIAQDKPHIERFLRQGDGTWIYQEAVGLDASMNLPSIRCALAEVYRRVEFDDAPPLAPIIED